MKNEKKIREIIRDNINAAIDIAGEWNSPEEQYDAHYQNGFDTINIEHASTCSCSMREYAMLWDELANPSDHDVIREDLESMNRGFRNGFHYCFDTERETVLLFFSEMRFEEAQQKVVENCQLFADKHGFEMSRENTEIFTFWK